MRHDEYFRTLAVVSLFICEGVFHQEFRALQSAEGQNMKPIMWAGIALIVLGALALALQGINYSHEKNVVDLGAIHVTAETQQRIPIPPVLGGLALAGGIALVVVGAKKKT
jgi:hypothetical protein